MTETTTISVRLTPAECAWLEVRKKENRSSINVEIVNAVRAAIAADPLTIFVHECLIPDEVFYTVSIGKFGDDYYEGPERSAAFAAARAKAKELGLARNAVCFAVEDFGKSTRHV